MSCTRISTSGKRRFLCNFSNSIPSLRWQRSQIGEKGQQEGQKEQQQQQQRKGNLSTDGFSMGEGGIGRMSEYQKRSLHYGFGGTKVTKSFPLVSQWYADSKSYFRIHEPFPLRYGEKYQFSR